MNNMCGRIVVPMVLLAGITSVSCRDNPTAPGHLDDLETQLVSGYIWADLMPVVPPDPVMCQLVITAKNTNSTSPMIGLKIRDAEVFLDSADVRLGAISFTTAWDGRLEPLEEDTVRLSKVMTQSSIFVPPCRKYVYLNIVIRDQLNASRVMKIDSLYFDCAS